MAKARPARKGVPSIIDAAGRSQPSHGTAPAPSLLAEEPTLLDSSAGGQNEELQSLKSAVQLLAEQQAVQAQCVNLLMKKIKDDIQPDAAEQNVEFPPPRDPAAFQLRSGQLPNQLEASDPANSTMLADVLEDGTVIDHPLSKANKNGKARVDKDPRSFQNWIAWKWRWAVEANKAKELSKKINMLEARKGRVHRDVGKNNNNVNGQGTRKQDNVLAKGLTRPLRLNLKGSSGPLASPTLTQSPSVQAFEDGDSGWKANTQVEGLQKQVSRLTACFNKMMPTLIFLVNRAGSQKLVNHCFSQWKALSNINNPKSQHQKQERINGIKPCSRVLKGLGINDPTLQNSKPQRVQRKASMADFIQLKSGPIPYASTSATTKALHTLQVSLHQELEELQGILASEVESLKRRVEAKRSTHDLKRYGGGGDVSRWKHDLVSVWEVCNNVAQLLNKARYKLPSDGELPLVTHPAGYVPVPHRNRHRNACHPIISITSPEPPRGTRMLPPTAGCGGTIVHVSPTRANGCHVRITPKGASRTATHVQAQEEWHGRQCMAAQHAASLRRQIERLKARHRSACARLQYHQELYPRLPHKTTLTLLQPPRMDSHKCSSKETQT